MATLWLERNDQGICGKLEITLLCRRVYSRVQGKDEAEIFKDLKGSRADQVDGKRDRHAGRRIFKKKNYW